MLEHYSHVRLEAKRWAVDVGALADRQFFRAFREPLREFRS
jgi:hypothetical protein